jgi:predicted transcriptional regulator
MSVTTQKTAEIEERRRKVAGLYLSRVKQEDIARQLGVSQPTVSLDIKAILAEYRAERHEQIDREAAELDAMEQQAAAGFTRRKDRQWLETRLKIKDRRAKLLGLDAPTKQEVSGPDGGDVRITYVNDWRANARPEREAPGD